MDHLIGQTLSQRYAVQNLLGQGGMGAVFKAEDTILKRTVAIKIMKPELVVQPDFRDRFLQEARTAARLRHPNIVQVFDFAQDGETLFIVMEFIQGNNLSQQYQEWRQRGEWMDLMQALELCRQLASALSCAHSEGVLHRDIKPANILLSPAKGEAIPFRPMLTDLGLAKLAEGGVVTMVGTTLGTPEYMSPEAALGKDTEARSDIYSLGVLLFEIVTRQLPFPAKSILDAIQMHGKQAPPKPKSLRPEIPETLNQLILKTLEKEPANRYPDAAALEKALEGVLNELRKPTRAPVMPTLDQATSVDNRDALDARSDSLLQEFSAKSARLDRIQVYSGTKMLQACPVQSNKIMIGRDAKSDLVLNDGKVSREHARIEVEGGSYRVIDLGSTNGTYMGDARLLPGVPELWTPDKVLHVGNFTLHLQPFDELKTSKPVSDGTLITSGTAVLEPIQKQPVGRGRVGIVMEKPMLQVEAGQPVPMTITLVNQGTLVEHLKINVDGIPAGWITAPIQVLQLMPGDREELTIAILPPRAAASKAGDYPVQVRATTKDATDKAEAETVLRVLPYSQFNSELTPPKILARRAGRVRIQNQGNSADSYTVNWQDRALELNFKPPQGQLKIAEGQVGNVEFRAAPRLQRIYGRQQSHQITVQVSASTGMSQTHNGEVISRPLIPMWVIPVIGFLCIMLGAAAALLAPPLILNPRKTETAISASQTSAAATQIALSDPDADGLSNVEEIALGTDPQNPDTDGDGLRDGAEIKQQGSDPLSKDSDQDTLPDGEEVAGGCTSPNNPDSDGDGAPDNVDPNACAQPTDTPRPTVTPTPTITPTPTPAPYFPCEGLYSSHLHVGDQAFVAEEPPVANNVRSEPDAGSELLGKIQPGEKVEIIGGPECKDWIWWKVRSLSTGLMGWTSEGDGKDYWLLPMSK